MLFNIQHGQVRFSSLGKPVFRHKAKFGRLYMMQIKGMHQGIYDADKLGNIDVRAMEHIDTMVGLGYPIYNGDGKTYPVPLDDLIYPNLDVNSEYWRGINEAKSR